MASRSCSISRRMRSACSRRWVASPSSLSICSTAKAAKARMVGEIARGQSPVRLVAETAEAAVDAAVAEPQRHVEVGADRQRRGNRQLLASAWSLASTISSGSRPCRSASNSVFLRLGIAGFAGAGRWELIRVNSRRPSTKREAKAMSMPRWVRTASRMRSIAWSGGDCPAAPARIFDRDWIIPRPSHEGLSEVKPECRP